MYKPGQKPLHNPCWSKPDWWKMEKLDMEFRSIEISSTIAASHEFGGIVAGTLQPGQTKIDPIVT